MSKSSESKGKPLYMTCPGAKLTPKEREFLKEMAQSVGIYHTVIVNIGVMWGASMHCLRAGAPEATLVGVDIDYGTYPIHKPEMLGDNVIFVTGDSKVVHKDFPDLRIDLLFIDGSHKYEDVREDIRWWVPKLADYGMVIFHDYAPAPEDMKRDPSLVGVKQAVNEWLLTVVNDFARVEAPDSIACFEVL